MKKAIVLLFLVLVFGGACIAQIVDQSQEVIGYGFGLNSYLFQRWQTFRPSFYNITGIDICIYKVGIPSSGISIEIKDSLTGTTEWTGYISESSIPPGINWIHKDVGYCDICAERPYYIILEAPAEDSDNQFAWLCPPALDETDYYPRGIADMTCGWPGKDYAFRTYGYPGGGTDEVSLISPTAGVTMYIADTFEIRWSSICVDFAEIEYSTNNGDTWITPAITESTPSDGSYDWLVPDTPSDSCIIKVSDVSDSTVFDISGIFTIAGSLTPPIITSYNIISGFMGLIPSYLRLNWSDSNSVKDCFRIYRSEDGGEYDTIAVVPPIMTFYNDLDYNPDVTTSYKVEVFRE